MPKPINPTIGRCKCYGRNCEEMADVRKMRDGKTLYLHCPACQTIRPKGRGFQDYILNNAEMFGPGGEPKPDEGPEKSTPTGPGGAESLPAPKQEEKPKEKPDGPSQAGPSPEPGRGFFSDADKQLSEFFRG